MKKILFSIGDGIYPYRVGGMEVFNYYLIKNLRNRFCIYYAASKKFDFDNVRILKTSSKIKPIKITFPLQLFFILLCHPSIKCAVFSYSASHWIIWKLNTLICQLLRTRYVVVIHHGKEPPTEKQKAYFNFFHHAKKVIAVSPDIKKNFDRQFQLNCNVIYPLVPFEESASSKQELRQQYGIPQDAKVICMVGTIKQMKNPDTVIKAGANVYWDEEHSRADSRGSILLGIAIAPAPRGRNSTLVLLNCSKNGMSGYVSAESGNLAELKDDGVFVPPLEWQTVE